MGATINETGERLQRNPETAARPETGAPELPAPIPPEPCTIINPECYLRRVCTGKWNRPHRFLWFSWLTVSNGPNANLFGAFYIGPFRSVADAASYHDYKPTDEFVPTVKMHPALVASHKQRSERDHSREQFFSPQELADPAHLLERLRIKRLAAESETARLLDAAAAARRPLAHNYSANGPSV